MRIVYDDEHGDKIVIDVEKLKRNLEKLSKDPRFNELLDKTAKALESVRDVDAPTGKIVEYVREMRKLRRCRE